MEVKLVLGKLLNKNKIAFFSLVCQLFTSEIIPKTFRFWIEFIRPWII